MNRAASVDDAGIQRAYDQVVEYCRQRPGTTQYMVEQSADYAKGLWKAYRSMLATIPFDYARKSVVDFGCKYGHLLPLLHALGCAEPIGVDAHDEYVRTGDAVFASIFHGARVLKTEEGYIPLQPESVDLVIMNEVISHVNPSYLDRVWAETARILRPGGMIYVSDGNNAANPCNRTALPELYEKWENGPEGARTDRDVVHRPFRQRRIDIIHTRHPSLPEAKVFELADNTSGMFGDFFLRTIDAYARTGELVRRPYRRGVCPANPEAGGYVMERAFDPELLEKALQEYGFEAYQVLDLPRGFAFSRRGLLGRARDMLSYGRFLLSRPRPAARGATQGFQLVARKPG